MAGFKVSIVAGEYLLGGLHELLFNCVKIEKGFWRVNFARNVIISKVELKWFFVAQHVKSEAPDWSEVEIWSGERVKPELPVAMLRRDK